MCKEAATGRKKESTTMTHLHTAASMANMRGTDGDPLSYISFSHRSFFVTGSPRGFAVYRLGVNGGVEERCRKDVGPVKIVEMLGDTNFLGIVGDDERPAQDGAADATTATTITRRTELSPYKVALWDAEQNGTFGVLQNFHTEILGLKMCKARAIVALKEHVYLYSLEADGDFLDAKKSITIEGAFNTGLMVVSLQSAVSSSLNSVFPGSTGMVHVLENAKNDTEKFVERNWKCHEQEVQCLGLSDDGSLLATASDGRNIHLYQTDSGTPQDAILELRRGSTACQMYSLSFSPDNVLLACSSSQ
eukprot:gene19409-961_t